MVPARASIHIFYAFFTILGSGDEPMRTDEDIDVLLKAKRDQRAVETLRTIMALCLAMILLVEAFDMFEVLTVPLATICIVLLACSKGPNSWIKVSREGLVSTLERLFHRDPDALRRLSEKNRDDKL